MKEEKRTRVAITVSPELRQALLEFSDVSGMSMSSFCRQMLEENIPLIQAMTKAYKVAYERPQEALTLMSEELDRAHAKSAQASLDLEESKKVIKLRKARNDRLVKD